jgi:hypothetical protein
VLVGAVGMRPECASNDLRKVWMATEYVRNSGGSRERICHWRTAGYECGENAKAPSRHLTQSRKLVDDTRQHHQNLSISATIHHCDTTGFSSEVWIIQDRFSAESGSGLGLDGGCRVSLRRGRGRDPVGG